MYSRAQLPATNTNSRANFMMPFLCWAITKNGWLLQAFSWKSYVFGNPLNWWETPDVLVSIDVIGRDNSFGIINMNLSFNVQEISEAGHSYVCKIGLVDG